MATSNSTRLPTTKAVVKEQPVSNMLLAPLMDEKQAAKIQQALLTAGSPDMNSWFAATIQAARKRALDGRTSL